MNAIPPKYEALIRERVKGYVDRIASFKSNWNDLPLEIRQSEPIVSQLFQGLDVMRRVLESRDIDKVITSYAEYENGQGSEDLDERIELIRVSEMYVGPKEDILDAMDRYFSDIDVLMDEMYDRHIAPTGPGIKGYTQRQQAQLTKQRLSPKGKQQKKRKRQSPQVTQRSSSQKRRRLTQRNTQYQGKQGKQQAKKKRQSPQGKQQNKRKRQSPQVTQRSSPQKRRRLTQKNAQYGFRKV